MIFYFNFICVKKFLAGLALTGKEISFLKKNQFSIKNYILKIKNKELKIINVKNDKYIKLLLNKFEINLIIFFLKNKNYKLKIIKVIKINNLYKIKINLIKKRG